MKLLRYLNMEQNTLFEKFKSNALAHAKTFTLKNVLPKYNAIYRNLCLKKNK